MSTLEAAVTLEDVFSVVEAKRVPLAPELAGYLTLEIADGSQAANGEVDPLTVYISEEGTVALVRPKKEGPSGDAETSVRAILGKLLAASGSATPALTASAKRDAGTGLPALVSELEAALIPVNRAAGRRALARLAREVKRVTQGVGRNASVPPPANRAPASVRSQPSTPDDAKSGSGAAPGPRGSFSDEALTARRVNAIEDLAAQIGAPDIRAAKGPSAGHGLHAPVLVLTPPPLPGTIAATAAIASGAPAASPASVAARAAPPVPLSPRAPAGFPPRSEASMSPPVVAPPLPVKAAGSGGTIGRVVQRTASDKLFGGDEVDSLLSTFEVSNVGEKQIRDDLKAIAGLEPTPPPPDAMTLAELTNDVGKERQRSERIAGDSVEALLALEDTSGLHASRLAQSATVVASETRSPPPGADATAASKAALRRPVTPRALGRPAPPPSAATRAPSPSGRRERLGDASAPSANQPPPRNATAGNFRQPRAPHTGMAMLVLTLVVLVAGGSAVWMFKPAFFTGKKKPVSSASSSAALPVPTAVRCKVALVVSEVPANAEILLRMGQAPLDVERMPVGTRLEFLATAEGYTPRRAVVKAESPWDKTPDGKPRIDVPIQLDPTKAKAGTIEPWPAVEPGSQVGGSGSPGTVHVISNVRGAEIWLLAGLGPEARIEQLRCDGDIDVLLAGPPQLRKRLHVGEKEIQAATADAQGNRVISVNAKN